MMSKDFETNFRQQLESTPHLRKRGKRLLDILNSRPSRRRTRQIERMEKHAVAEIHLNRPAVQRVGPIDWSKIDWGEVIEMVLKVLLMLLPLLLAKDE